MRSIRFQFLISFAVFGAWLPFYSEYLRATCGFSEFQIGTIFAAGSVGFLFTPVLVTFLADALLPARRLLSVLFTIAGAVCLGMYLIGDTNQYWPVLILFVVFNLAFAPVTPLNDGLFFNDQQRRIASGLHGHAYHRVRVYGTIGFLLPNLALFAMLHNGLSIDSILLVAAAMCLLGLLNSFVLPNLQPDKLANDDSHTDTNSSTDQDTNTQPPSDDRKLTRFPTKAAARALLEPHVLTFCIALFLVQLAVAPYYTFYPRYLREVAEIDVQWLGLIACIGVTIEIFFILAFGRLSDRLGLKTLMVIGVLCMAVRLFLLGLVPTPFIAIASQVFHGMWVLVVHVAPPLYLSKRATGTFRNSILGLFAIVVYGSGRILGNLLGGYVAETSLNSLFIYSAVLCVLAAVLLIYAFKDENQQDSVTEQHAS